MPLRRALPAVLIAVGLLMTAQPAQAQSGPALDVVTVGPKAEAVGTAELVAGRDYVAVITGQLDKTFFQFNGTTTMDAFYCYTATDPTFCPNQNNPTEMLYGGTTGTPNPLPLISTRVLPSGKAPPYEADHSYTVTLRIGHTGKLRLATLVQCSVGMTACSGPGYRVELYAKDAPTPTPTPTPVPAAEPAPAITPPAVTPAKPCELSASAALIARVAGECRPGMLPIGGLALLPVPAANATADISPELIAAATQQILMEIAAREESTRKILAAIKLKLRTDAKFSEAFEGCLLFAEQFEDLPEYILTNGTRINTNLACGRLLTQEGGAAPVRARAAAGRACRPVFVSRRKLTTAARKRLDAQIRKLLDVSCTTRSGGGMTIRIRPRAKKLKLTQLVDRRIGAAATLAPGAAAAGDRLAVRWTAGRRQG